MNRIITESIGDHRTGMRRFHVKTRLSTTIVMSEYIGEDGRAKLTAAGASVLDRLLAIDGLEKVTVDGYAFSTHIGDAFGYESDGITTRIVNLLALELGYDEFEFERRDDAWPFDMYDMDGAVIRREAKYPDNHERRVCRGVFA